MRIKNTLFYFVLLMGLNAYAGSDDRVRDELITTPDRTCAIHYLTQGNTVGWYVTEVEGSCPNGLLNGAGKATLRNAFGKVVRQIAGFFTHGYPTREDYGEITLKTLWLSDSSTQSLVFDLGSGEANDIHYLGKMTSTRQSDEAYSAFDACHPATILALTKDEMIFGDETVQQDLIDAVLNRVAPICPDAPRIYVYGSSKENPENKDIAFFADIDLDSGHIKVRRLPISARVRDVLGDPEAAADFPVPKEIRRETGLPVVQITPVKPEVKPLPHPIPEPTIEPRIKKQPIPQPESPSPAMIQPPAPMAQTQIPSAPAETKASESSWDDVPALLTASRLLKQPVEGKVLLHIARFDATGLAITDAPVALRLKGNNLPLGWVGVMGTFSHTPPQASTDTLGFVQVQTFTPIGDK